MFPITAWSLLNALGQDVDAVGEALLAGRGRTSPIDVGLEEPFAAGVVNTPLDDAGYATRYAALAAVALRPVEHAVRRSVGRWGAERVGVVIGATTQWFQGDGFRSAELVSLDEAHAELMRTLGRDTGAEGPAYVVSAACASSAKALGSAKRLIEQDVVDAVLVGGVDTLTATTIRGFRSIGVLTPAPCRPFGAERTGINLGEGAAFALVERDGDPLALLLGAGDSSDASSMVTPDPEGRGAAEAMQAAMDDAGVRADEVGHVNAHATGTVLNDAAEAAAIRQVLGERAAVVATKGATGHLLGGAGLTEAVFAALSLRAGTVPPSPGSDPVDPQVSVDVVLEPRPQSARVALSNSFGFGGANTCVVVGAP